MKRTFLLLFFLSASTLFAQEAFTSRSGRIAFNASTPLEDIEAENDEVNAILKPGSGDLGLVLLIRDFVFPRALMQEHFNENYLESDTYPKATFRGRLQPAPERDRPVPENIRAEGTLTIHGVSREVSIPVDLRMADDRIYLESQFIIRPEDYDIEVPKLLFTKIAREVQVNLSLELKP